MKVSSLSRVIGLLTALSLAAILSADPANSSNTGDDVLARYLDNHRHQRLTIRDVSMEVDIEANLPELKKTGVMQALRKVSEIGKITYKILGFEGDNMVKKDVIARYIEAEVKSSDSKTRDSLAIDTNNYKFKYWGKFGSGDWTLHLFELKPRTNRLGMYEGWLWIHAGTGMPVRESGRLVKTPSVFLKRVDFVKDYEMIDGIAVPSKIATQIKTRLVGPAEITISFKNYDFHGEQPKLASWATHPRASGQ